jgi:hypothetical protein
MSQRNREAKSWSLVIATMLPMAFASGVSFAGPVSSEAMQIVSPFTDDHGAVATNISGITCLPPVDGKFVCLAIDDEGRMAQAATIEGSQLRAGGKIKIIGKTPPPDIVGTKPRIDACLKGEDTFKDLDGEAVAHDGKFFYVTGSHGCSRHSNKFRASSFVLARIPNDTVTAAAQVGSTTVSEGDSISTTYRLSEALLIAPSVKDFFARDLMTKNGMNIEGLAISDGKLYVGLRAPVVGDQAFLVEIDVDLLFDANRPIVGNDVKEISLSLGAGRGIRDLAWLSDGRLLILSGPAQEDPIAFAVHAVDLRGDRQMQTAILDDIAKMESKTKAEGLHVLGKNGNTFDLIVMFDGPESGGPRRYELNLD